MGKAFFFPRNDLEMAVTLILDSVNISGENLPELFFFAGLRRILSYLYQTGKRRVLRSRQSS